MVTRIFQCLRLDVQAPEILKQTGVGNSLPKVIILIDILVVYGTSVQS